MRINGAKDLGYSIGVICRSCSYVNAITKSRCTRCGKSLSGTIDYVDRRSGINRRYLSQKVAEERREGYDRRILERRKYHRYNVNIIPLHYEILSNLEDKKVKKNGIASTLNLSKVGVFIKTDSVAKVGSICRVKFKLEDDCEAEIVAIGEVIRVVEKKNDAYPNGMAVLFKEITDSDQSKIDDFLDGLLEKDEE